MGFAKQMDLNREKVVQLRKYLKDMKHAINELRDVLDPDDIQPKKIAEKLVEFRRLMMKGNNSNEARRLRMAHRIKMMAARRVGRAKAKAIAKGIAFKKAA